MDKYIESRYHQAAREWRTAITQDERNQASAEMARLEGLAMQFFGFAYADALHATEWGE